MACILRMLYSFSFRRAFVVFTGLRIDSFEKMSVSFEAERSYWLHYKWGRRRNWKAFIAVNVFRNKSVNNNIERFWAWYQNVFERLIYCVLPKDPVWGEQQFVLERHQLLRPVARFLSFSKWIATLLLGQNPLQSLVVSASYVTTTEKSFNRKQVNVFSPFAFVILVVVPAVSCT